MLNLTVFLLYFLAFVLCAMVLKQGLSQSVNLLSARNLYLFGFIIYQLVNPANALRTGNFTFFQVDNPAQTGKTFLVFAFLFLCVLENCLLFFPWLQKTKTYFSNGFKVQGNGETDRRFYPA